MNQMEAVEAAGFLESFILAFQRGEVFMYFIALSLIFALAITLERFMRLKQYQIDGASFMFEIQKYILANDVDGAIRICNGTGNAALPKVIKSGLQRASREESQIQNAIDATSLEVIPKLERRLPYLATIANIATLLGLLGTITGLIRAFQGVGASNAQQRQEILSAGIAEAMNATAFGLMTAVITMVAHSYLSNKSTHILSEIDEFGVKLMDLLSARKYQEAGGD